jgi:cell division protein FtsI (penicillin-binding protein 3)
MRQMMEGVVLRGTGKAARLAGYTSGGKTGSAQIFDVVAKHYTHLYNGSFVGFAPVTNPAVVIAVTLNGVKMFGGVVAGPVFKNVATETLRLLAVPKDLPDTEPAPLTDPEEANDVAIADMSTPPEDLAPIEQPPASAPAGVARAGASAGLAPAARAGAAVGEVPLGIVAVAGPAAPRFEGKTVRAVLEESLAMGVPVEVVGSGIARQQAPAPGSPLNPGERVRVMFQ